MIELRDVSKRYGQTQALHPTNLSFRPRQTCALLGPSGCGKSTLLRLLVGLVEPSEGMVVFDGQALSAENIQQIRRRIGYVIQRGGLFPHLTASQNVSLLARHLRWSEGESRARVAELAELTRLPESRMRRYPKELSGGERQRVALMRALMLEPEALLLDEPLGALDPLVRAELQDELAAIFERISATVIIVTHDVSEAARLGQRIVLMRSGRVEQDGSWQELRDAPANEFVSNFLNALRPRPL